MEKIKKYYDEFQVIDSIKEGIKEQLPDSPENQKNKQSAYNFQNSRRMDLLEDFEEPKPKNKGRLKLEENQSPRESKGGGLFSGMTNFFKKSKKEQKDLKEFSTSGKRLPKNFANLVLDYELKIDSGGIDLETVDKLMQLYS